MILIKIIIKIALLPVLLLTIIGQWIEAFFTGSALDFLGQETVRMIVVSIIASVIPKVCTLLLEGIVGLRCVIGNYMRS